MKSCSLSLVLLCGTILLGGIGFFGTSFAQYVGEDYCDYGDLMQQAYCLANRKETIIDLGNTKNAVGNEMIKGKTEINLDFDPETDILKQRPSTIIKITQFILMLTIVLSVTMTIINGILYITKSGNGEDPSKARWNLVYIACGILVALFSVVIINLLRSVGESTLKEISYHQHISDTSHLV